VFEKLKQSDKFDMMKLLLDGHPAEGFSIFPDGLVRYSQDIYHPVSMMKP
jgi:hypothetical protein